MSARENAHGPKYTGFWSGDRGISMWFFVLTGVLGVLGAWAAVDAISHPKHVFRLVHQSKTLWIILFVVAFGFGLAVAAYGNRFLWRAESPTVILIAYGLIATGLMGAVYLIAIRTKFRGLRPPMD
jgi:hypothetical protein